MAQILIHIGYPKTGSTYLQEWFSKNPSTHYNPKAIAGFYNAHDIARYAMNKEKIHDWLVLSSEDLSVWKGDVDIVGLKGKPYDREAYHHKLCETLHSIFSSPKILIVTRGYASMFPSLYSQYIRGGGTLTFEDLQADFGSHFAQTYGYTWVIELYQKIFGKQNVIVLPFELLNDNPSFFIGALEEKLNIKNHFEFSSQKINASPNPRLITVYRKFSKLLVALLRPLPYQVQKKIFEFYIQQLAADTKYSFAQFAARFIKEEEKFVVNQKLLQSLKGTADILKEEKIYQPYLKEYLL